MNKLATFFSSLGFVCASEAEARNPYARSSADRFMQGFLNSSGQGIDREAELQRQMRMMLYQQQLQMQADREMQQYQQNLQRQQEIQQQEQNRQSAIEQILEAHPDIGKILNSPKFATWYGAQPEPIQQLFNSNDPNVVNKGISIYKAESKSHKNRSKP